MVTYKIKLIKIIKECKDVYTFLFEKPDVIWEEGTNVHLTFVDDFEKALQEKIYMRHLSIMNLVDEPYIAFTTRITDQASDFKNKLKSLTVGDSVLIYKLSQRMQMRRENRPVLLLTMGVGTTALKPMMETYEKDQSMMPMMTHLNISKGMVLFEEVFRKMNFVKHVFTQNRKVFYDQLNELLVPNQLIYMVGSDAFLEDLLVVLLEKGYDPEDLMMDKKPDKIEQMLIKAKETIKSKQQMRKE